MIAAVAVDLHATQTLLGKMTFSKSGRAGAGLWCQPRYCRTFAVRGRESLYCINYVADRNRLGQDNTMLKVRIRSEVRAGGHVDNRKGGLIRPGPQPQRATRRRSDAQMHVCDENIGAAGGGQESPRLACQCWR